MTITYQDNDPKGWCGDMSRGAALGRSTIHEAPKSFNGHIRMRRTYLDQGGYDSNGTYFGHGAPLYWYHDDEGDIDGMVRGGTRAAARAEVLGMYPDAKVRR